MNTRLSWIAPSLLAVGVGLAVAQTQSTPLIKNTFQESDGGWTGLGQTAKVSLTHDAALVTAGRGALKFDYKIAKGEMNALVLPAGPGSLARAKSIKFRIRSDSTTILAIALQEQDGGRYATMCMVPKDKWQDVELSTADFVLSQEKDDPKDPDGKLDLDAVSGIAIADVSQFFVQGGNSALTEMANVRTGSHTLYIDDFTVSSDDLPSSSSSAAGTARIDTFYHPQLSWFALGGAKLSHASGKPLETAGLQADYRQAPGKVVLLTRGIEPGLLKGTSSLQFDAASLQEASLIVQVEETDGGKYNTSISVPAGSELQHVNLKFSDFKAADDSKDSDDKLDMDKIKSVLIMDASGMFAQADHDNTLWIGNIRATK